MIEYASKLKKPLLSMLQRLFWRDIHTCIKNYGSGRLSPVIDYAMSNLFILLR